jgi:hypothetical protein
MFFKERGYPLEVTSFFVIFLKFSGILGLNNRRILKEKLYLLISYFVIKHRRKCCNYLIVF